MKWQEWVIFAVVVVVFAAVLYASFRASDDCAAKGGVLVRGVAGYACVEGK